MTNTEVAVEIDGRRFSSIEPETVEWVWPGHIPKGKLTVIDGMPGVGKSTLTVDLAARATRGLPMPDGSPTEATNVAILSHEDGHGDTIRPRLDAAGADPSKVFAVDGIIDWEYNDAKCFTINLETCAALSEYLSKWEIGWFFIDPLVAYLEQADNSHKDQDMRRALTPLAAVAEGTGTAIVFLRHLNKTNVGPAMYRGGGSVGIVGIVRAGFLCARDPEDDDPQAFVFASTKMNLAKHPPTLRYRMVSAGDVAKLEWRGESTQSADDVLAAQDHGDRGPRDEARDFILAELEDGERPSAELIAKAKAQGIHPSTLYRARRDMGIKPRKDGFGPGAPWVWKLKEDHPEPPIEYHTHERGVLCDSEARNPNGSNGLPIEHHQGDLVNSMGGSVEVAAECGVCNQPLKPSKYDGQLLCPQCLPGSFDLASLNRHHPEKANDV